MVATRPVLIVDADALNGLEDEVKFGALLSLLAKHKDAVQDGLRLENLCWRLWFNQHTGLRRLAFASQRETLLSQQQHPLRSPSFLVSDGSGMSSDAEGRSLLSCTAAQEQGKLTVSSSHAPYYRHNHTSPPESNLARYTSGIKDPLFETRSSDRSSTTEASSWQQSDTVQPTPSTTSTCRVTSVGKSLAALLPDKFEGRDGEYHTLRQREVPAEQKVVLPTSKAPPMLVVGDATESVTPPAPLKVVIVNPTPHPTPPMTPHIPAESIPPPIDLKQLTLTVPANRVLGFASPKSKNDLPANHSSADPAGPHANPVHDPKFYIDQGGDSPDGDSPRTSTSSQTGGLTRREEVADEDAQSRSNRSAGSDTQRSLSRTRKGKETRVSARVGMGRTQSTHRMHASAQAKANQRPTATKVGSGTGSSNSVRVGTGSGGKRTKSPHHPHHQLPADNVMGPSAPHPHRKMAQQSKPLVPAHAPVVERASVTRAMTEPAQFQHHRTPPAPPNAQVKGAEPIQSESEFETTDDDESWSDESDEVIEGIEERATKTGGERAHMRDESTTNLEADYQRDMFAKKPTLLYTNLKRTQSGMLTSLFHPDPELFPPNHPYRTTRSTQDILAKAKGEEQAWRRGYVPAPLPLKQGQRGMPVVGGISRGAPMATTTMTSAAPVASNVTVQASSSANRRSSQMAAKGREPGMEFETESEGEGENAIQMSSSLAMQRLAALDKANRSQQQGSSSQQKKRQDHAKTSGHPHKNGVDQHPPQQPRLTSVATMPVSLCYPYNMPAPMAPSTPRTTRRNFLSNELSESLRRNLLWERQVSKQRPMAPGAGVRRSTSGATTSAGALGGAAGGSGEPGAPLTQEERTRRALARNRSWVDDFHACGW